MADLERQQTLELAGKLHEKAHQADGGVMGFANEVYLISDDHEAPLPSEKIRINSRNSRVTPISRAALYLPIVHEADNPEFHEILPRMLFAGMWQGVKKTQRLVLAESGLLVFDKGVSWKLDAANFYEHSEHPDIRTLFPQGRELERSDEEALLELLQDILSDRHKYRVSAQRPTKAA